MKKLLFPILALVLALGLTLPMAAPAAAHTEDEPYEATLYAGQNIDVGTVSVWNDGTNLYVKYETADGWQMRETHLAVATSLEGIPQTKKGNPKVGKFTYQTEHDPWVTACTHVINLAELGSDVKKLYIAAHAKVCKVIGDGCSDPQWASRVEDYVQGTLKNGYPLTNPARTDPTKALGPPDASTSPPATGFYSLGYVSDDKGYIELSFGYPVVNTAGTDIVVYEVTWGRPGYPVEKAEVWVKADGLWYPASEVSNKDNGTGIGRISIPDGILLVDGVKLIDSTNDPRLGALADGYDVDAVGACYLFDQQQTAWADGDRFTKRGSWATYFTYEIQ